VFLCGYFHVKFLHITSDLCDALENVVGVFRHTADEVVFFRVHECVAQWARVIRTEEQGSPLGPAHASLVGDSARQFLAESIGALLAASDSSPFPHFPDYAALGRWESMTAPF
jgi:hypothetical protein